MEKMSISDQGLEHLIKLEGGARLVMYNDLGGERGHCTIGVGHLVHKGVCNSVAVKHRKAADEFLEWNRMTIAGKKVEISGLTNRRLAEKALFEKAVKP